MTSTQRNAGMDGAARTGGTDEGLRGTGLALAVLRAGVPILLATLAAGYVAHHYSEGQPTVYESSSRVVLSSSGNFAPVDNSFGGNDRYVQNQAQIMTTLPVLDRAAAVVADGIPGSDLRGLITAEPQGASDVITVTAQASDPALAARRADAVATGYSQFTSAEVATLADQAAAASAADPVAVQNIRARAATFGDGVAVIQPAVAPSAPTSPTPKRDALLAAAAVFLLSSGAAAFWLSRRRPSGPDSLAADLGGPLLGEVPARWYGSVAVPNQPGGSEYGMALQALHYRLRRTGDLSVLLTTIGHDTSASSAALGLASAEAAQGRDVVLVDATTNGRLFRRAGVSAPAVSLTAAMAGGDGLDAALVNVPALTGPDGGSVRLARMDGMSVDILRRSLATLQTSGHLILVDGGAAVHDPAAFALLGEVGAVVAVVRNKRHRKELRELRRRLIQAGRECDGVLITHRMLAPALTAPSATAVWTAPAPVTTKKAPPPARHPATTRSDTTEPSATGPRPA
jgi:capsular polysaccharide biosynthesis protein